MLKIEFSKTFKKDYQRALKRGFNITNFEYVVNILRKQEKLPSKYRDHALVNSRNYKYVRECHVENDFLLVYRIYKDRLILELLRLGTHSDLFG